MKGSLCRQLDRKKLTLLRVSVMLHGSLTVVDDMTHNVFADFMVFPISHIPIESAHWTET